MNSGSENMPVRNTSPPKSGDESLCVALIAHDRQKPALIEFVRANESLLCKCACIATGTTGKRLNEATGLAVECMASGPFGGDILIAAEVASKHCDAVIFLRDPLTAHPHESDIAALGRLCDVHDIPIATNLSTAHAILDSLADGRERPIQREPKNRW